MKGISIFALVLCVMFLLACGSSQPKPKDVPVDKNAVVVGASNEQLIKLPIVGFEYKKANINSAKWKKWAAGAAPAIKEVISKLPEGYVLQITGHTDQGGPEEPEGKKPGNIKISENRAKAVYELLKKQGIDMTKVTVKGMGSSEIQEGLQPRDPKNRRVTFKVVPK